MISVQNLENVLSLIISGQPSPKLDIPDTILRRLAAWSARQVRHLMHDPRSRQAVDNWLTSFDAKAAERAFIEAVQNDESAARIAAAKAATALGNADAWAAFVITLRHAGHALACEAAEQCPVMPAGEVEGVEPGKPSPWRALRRVRGNAVRQFQARLMVEIDRSSCKFDHSS